MEVNVFEHSFYAELYQRHALSLFVYAHHRLSSREEAEDIVLDVFLSVLQNTRFATFDEKRQEAWLWTVTRNKVVDAYRRSTRRPQVPLEWFSETLLEDDELSPEQHSIKREEYERLARALQGLPRSQQTVLRLHFGHDLKCNEIAPLLEKSEEAVRMLLFRSLQRLRALYKPKGKGDQR